MIPDFSLRGLPFLGETIDYEWEAVEKHLFIEGMDVWITRLIDDFVNLKDFTADDIEKSLRARADVESIKAGVLIHAVRVLAVGTRVSPGIFEVLELMGRDKTLARLKHVYGLLARQSGEKNDIF